MKLYLAILATVATVAGFFTFRAVERGYGARDAQIAQLKQGVDSLTKVAARVDTLIVHDTIRFTKVEKVYDSARAVVETKWLHDTIPVPVTVVREIVKDADSTILACKVTVSDCMKEVGVQKDMVANLTQQIRLLKQQQPSTIVPHFGFGAAAGINPQGKLDAVAGLTLNWKIP